VRIVWRGVDALIPWWVLLRISTVPHDYCLFSKALEILASVIEKFVWGESGSEEVDKQDGMDDKSMSSSFVAET